MKSYEVTLVAPLLDSAVPFIVLADLNVNVQHFLKARRICNPSEVLVAWRLAATVPLTYVLLDSFSESTHHDVVLHSFGEIIC